MFWSQYRRMAWVLGRPHLIVPFRGNLPPGRLAVSVEGGVAVGEKVGVDRARAGQPVVTFDCHLFLISSAYNPHQLWARPPAITASPEQKETVGDAPSVVTDHRCRISLDDESPGALPCGASTTSVPSGTEGPGLPRSLCASRAMIRVRWPWRPMPPTRG